MALQKRFSKVRKQFVDLPITFRLDATIIMTAINGAETSPFTTAAQKRAFTGSMCRKFSGSPKIVAAQMTA
jgi:hypothetical protein